MLHRSTAFPGKRLSLTRESRNIKDRFQNLKIINSENNLQVKGMKF